MRPSALGGGLANFDYVYGGGQPPGGCGPSGVPGRAGGGFGAHPTVGCPRARRVRCARRGPLPPPRGPQLQSEFGAERAQWQAEHAARLAATVQEAGARLGAAEQRLSEVRGGTAGGFRPR